ncbi:general transcription factor IIE subunit 1 [Ornithorhynchus anatinus]|uniref:General transcription factor IIE subunit 1 n=1 Tax=Ornithorhynchus anatinus TaxID=9258 RepID=F7CJV3_ORNAN|nr:general transcription factor IIE subunit 1 [Ornithorhynchus anatinus]
MTDPDVLTEVPAALKRLAKYVVRGFYGLEHALALDILIRNPCVKEEDMLELLKFDRKQLRAVLNTLKGDKFIKCRMRVETAADGKTTRHNYYFINYRLLVNVVKYKLDHMRRRIETDERDSTNRASFKCPVCFSTFTDLEANQLFDPMTGTFRCTFCETEVEEDESAMPKKDARTLVARFNEQIEPIYVLLRETEDVNLAYEILEPEPAEIPALKQSKERAAAAAGAPSLAGGPPREAWATRGPSYEDLYTQKVIISMDDREDVHRAAAEGKPPRERPVWLRESTVQGAYDHEDGADGALGVAGFQDRAEGRGAPDDNEEVMRALLIHEKKTPSAAAGSAGAAAPRGPGRGSDSDSETSESDEESPPPRPAAFPAALPGRDGDGDEDEFEEVADDPVVTVAGRPFSYGEVSQQPELVAQMTPEEKEAYITMGQRMFEDMYE